MRSVGETKQRAITQARQLLQGNGYNGFTFQQLADELGIKKPSLYEHFKSKEDLGIQVIEEAKLRFIEWSETISVFAPDAQIGALFEVFYKFSCDGSKLCPISALIGDFSAYPKKMKSALFSLYESRRVWLEEVVKSGQKQGFFKKDKSPKEFSDLIVSIGLGAQMVARVTQRPEYIREKKSTVLDLLKEIRGRSK